MPSIITHTLMAEKVLRSLPDAELKTLINNNKQAFLLGVNGPDFLYFYDAMPWNDQKMRSNFTYLANEIHSGHINDFYQKAINVIKNQRDQMLKDVMISYLAGHLCHWALDCTAHPFIFYRTNGTTEETKYWHYRYEAMIDTYMMNYFKAEELVTYPPANLLEHDDLAIEAITKIYAMPVKEIWDFDLNEKNVNKAFKDFHNILMLVYDPIGIWFNIIQTIEIIQKKKWSLTGHFLMLKLDDTKDILNLTKQKWSNPCDCSEVHHDSFIELFDDAIELGVKTLVSFDKVMQKDRATALLNLINNRSYDTGYPDFRTMKYYDSIY